MGSSVNTAMTVTMITLISTNVLMGQSAELLWGFLNTVQLMYFFPVLQLYFPDNLAAILTYFSSAKMNIRLPFIDSMKESLKKDYQVQEKVDMPVLNSRFESIGYESTGFLATGIDMFTLVIQGAVICVIVFALRAILFTLTNNVDDLVRELKELENQNAPVHILNTTTSDASIATRRNIEISGLQSKEKPSKLK